jgi:hypothetical protein
MTSFFECPSHHIEVVVIPVTDFNNNYKTSAEIHDKKEDDKLLTQIFQNLTAITENQSFI